VPGGSGAAAPSAFGQTASPFGQQQATSAFGQPAAPSAFGGSPAFGAQSQQARPGTGQPPYQPTRDTEQNTSGKRMEMVYHCITTNPAYRNKSFEELRIEDYQQGNKGRGGAAPAAGGFGSSPTGAFGPPATSSPFGAPAPAPGAFGAAPAFGAPAPAAGGLFGSAPAPAAGGFGFGASTTTSPFGAPAPAAGGLFGAPAPAPGGLFGSAPAPAPGAFGAAPAFGAPGGSLFGAPKPAGGGLFGAAAPAPSAFGAAPAFGAPAAGGLFGSAAAPAFGAPKPAGGLFGAPAPAAGGGLFGASAPAAGGLFGSAAPATAFGAPAFGAPKPAGGLFGAPAPAAGGGLFGAPAPAAGGLFGSAPAPGAFGAPAAGGGLFGAPKPAGSLFGAPAPAAGGGLFGSAPAAGGGLFGSAPAPGAFRAPTAGGGLFGAPKPAGGMFGAAPAPSAFSLGGTSTGGGLFGGAPSTGFGAQAGGLFGGGAMSSPPGAQQQQQQSLATSPYGAGAGGSVAALAQRSAALEARLGPSVVGVSEADATARYADRVADGAAARLDTFQHGAARRSDAGRRALDAAMAGPMTYSPSARALPRSRHDTPSRAARPSLAGSPAPSAGRPSPAAYLGLGHRRLVLDAEARRSPMQRSSRPFEKEASSAPALAAPPRPDVAPLALTGGAPSPAPPPLFGAAEPPTTARASRAPLNLSPFESAPTPTQQLDRVFHEHGQPTPRSSVAGSVDARSPPSARASVLASPLVDPLSSDGLNPNAPKLVKVGFVTEPSMATLERLSDDELAAVHAFAVERPDFGRVEWLGRVDVRGVDLDRDVRICERDGPPEVEVYDDDDASKPAVGSKLNRPAIVTLLNVGPGADASEAERTKWSRRVEKATKRMGASLVDFDPVSGVWKFKTPHF